MPNNFKRIEFICSNCGKKTSKAINQGRPDPGQCSKRPNRGPHNWRINRKV